MIIKAFFFDAYQIPTSSMENTLLAGDFIIVGKAAYTISTPREIPIVNLKIPHTNIYEMGKPELNDVVVFSFTFDTAAMPTNYVKRIVGCPGDTLQIINKEIFVNGKKLDLPSTFSFSKEKLKGKREIDSTIFPKGAKWNADNYGPLILPKVGDTVSVTAKNYERWKDIIIKDIGKKVLREEGSVITLDGWPITEYVIKKNHYFVVGDNFDVSMDSRFFGFITEEMIIGKAIFIYWSFDVKKDAPGPLGFLSALRIERIFKWLN